MTAYPRVAFVSAPDVGATVRLDLNEPIGAAGCQVNADGFTLGAPSLDGDPTAVGQVWGYRAITLTPRLTGSKAAALAALSTLSREQLRAENWLLFQLDASTDPAWFKVYRSSPQPLSLDEVDVAGRNPDAWQTTLTLTADAFAYGPRETISTVQVIQGPADLTSPTRKAMRAVLPAIKGDAPTGLRVKITPATGISNTGAAVLLGCISGTSAMSMPVMDIGTGDGLSTSNGTSAGTSGSNYFNGSYRTATIAATAGNFLPRVGGTLPAVPGGKYKVMLRVDIDQPPTHTSKPYLFGLRYAPSYAAGPVTLLTVGDPALTSSGPYRGWVDLGDFTFPPNYHPPADVVGTLTAPAIDFQLHIGTADDSAGVVRLDAIRLIPVGGPTVTCATLLRGDFLGAWHPYAGGVSTFDADDDTYWQTEAGVLQDAPLTGSGSFPVADPAAEQNVLIYMVLAMGVGISTASIADAGAQSAVDISYSPRRLHL